MLTTKATNGNVQLGFNPELIEESERLGLSTPALARAYGFEIQNHLEKTNNSRPENKKLLENLDNSKNVTDLRRNLEAICKNSNIELEEMVTA